MAISFVNQASAAATQVTLPTGILAGDLILLFAYANTAVNPSLPTGYTNISTQNANSNGMRAAFFIATGTESGTLSPASTSATLVIAAVYRGTTTAVGGAGSSTNATSTSDAITGIATFTNTGGSSWAVSFSGSVQATSMSTPAGSTLRKSITGTGQMAILVDSNAGVSTWGQHTSTLGATAVSAGGSVELLAAATATVHNLVLLGVGV